MTQSHNPSCGLLGAVDSHLGAESLTEKWRWNVNSMPEDILNSGAAYFVGLWIAVARVRWGTRGKWLRKGKITLSKKHEHEG